ncbi:organic solvent ABC transporter [Pseudidiomarina salinarum]|uniref:Organic solvent ABC transporter n=1 Tax=Pseudidiomarina salinarum TaxID=435908 RepID=A0A094IVP6_9GAMM|nr:ABC transporter substrate-binding protein [Pseudidiomarina salinarum]KFZ31207.1 organic solvent ABC transporter [Pseudidiomarina salinarum]RUO71045.1 organic solvent ABC transporter [Pseudidiomarina salinarum]
MKNWISLLVVAVLAMTTMATARAEIVREENPYFLLEKVAKNTFERIEADREKIDKDLDYLRVIIREELLPYVDNVYAAKRVLGRNLKDTTEEQRQEFYNVFRDYLIATYGRAFTRYDEDKHTVEFGDARRFEGDSKMVEVKTRLIEQGREPIRIEFKMRYDDDENLWKAYDMVVEGVSLLSSKQAEISSVIRSRGIDGTIELLREKANEPMQPYEEGAGDLKTDSSSS